MRQAFFMNVMGQKDFSNLANHLFVGTLMVTTTTISILFPKITAVLGILGGLVGVKLSYMIPLIIQIQLSAHRWYHPSNLKPLLFFGTLIMMGYMSVVMTLI